MFEKPNEYLESCRVTKGPLASRAELGNNGAFEVVYRGNKMQIIVSDGGGWDHVSVSCTHRVPTWMEMCWIKDQFFGKNEMVLQYHPREEDYVNFHPNCLHLWRPQGADVPTPPSWMVGPKAIKISDDTIAAFRDPNAKSFEEELKEAVAKESVKSGIAMADKAFAQQENH